MDGTGLDQPEISDQDAVVREVLDAADEIAERGVHLFDDRDRGAGPRVADKSVDLVAVERAAQPAVERLLVLALRLDHEHGDVVDEVAAHRFEVLDHPR